MGTGIAFKSQPVFWLPYNKLPFRAQWLLSFPKAPLGSVSVQVWMLGCGAAILLVSNAVRNSAGSAKVAAEKTKLKKEL
jgi:hypothetical protein